MFKKELAVRHSTILFTYLFVVWGLYRMLFKLPVELEELLIKPLVWLIPLFIFLKKEKLSLSSLGITSKNLFPAIYLSLSLGILFAIEGVLVNLVKYKAIDFSANLGENSFLIALLISFTTAISEEITFRGYIFNRFWYVLGSEWIANLISSFGWALIHIPIAVFWWELSLVGVLGYLVLTMIFGIGSAFVFARTKNVFASIFLHLFWEWPIVLFR